MSFGIDSLKVVLEKAKKTKEELDQTLIILAALIARIGMDEKAIKFLPTKRKYIYNLMRYIESLDTRDQVTKRETVNELKFVLLNQMIDVFRRDKLIGDLKKDERLNSQPKNQGGQENYLNEAIKKIKGIVKNLPGDPRKVYKAFEDLKKEIESLQGSNDIFQKLEEDEKNQLEEHIKSLNKYVNELIDCSKVDGNFLTEGKL